MKVILLLMFFLIPQVYCETQVFEAVAKSDGRVAYFERHTVVFDGQAVIKLLTEYIDPNGKLIGSMRSDFTHSLSAPEFILRDGRSHTTQGLHWEKNKIEVFSRDSKTHKGNKAILRPQNEVMISGPGLIYYIAGNMNKIISQNGIDFKYVIPGRRDAFDFEISPVAHDDEKAEFEVKIKSWLMRIFSPRLRLIFDLRKKRLMSFEGLSNIRDDEGEMMSVDVQYLYQN